MTISATQMLVVTAVLLLLPSPGSAKDSNDTVPLVLWHGMGKTRPSALYKCYALFTNAMQATL